MFNGEGECLTDSLFNGQEDAWLSDLKMNNRQSLVNEQEDS